MEFRFYIYRHIRKDINEPFYIGIGTKPKKYTTHAEEYKRAFKSCDRKQIWKNIVSKTDFKVDIISESNDYEEIKAMEKYFISLYGRKNNRTGILSNLTDGGEGTHGRIWKPTKEHIEKVIESNKRRKLTPEHLMALNNGRRNKPTSEESRKRYSLSKIGIKPTEESKLKNSIAHRNGNHPKAKKVICTESGIIFDCVKDAAKHFGRNYNRLSRNIRERPHTTTLIYYYG